MKYYNILNKIRNESIFSIISRALNAFLFYLITAKVSRNSSIEDFAVWTIFITAINLLPLLSFGLTTGLVNRLSFNNSIMKENKNIENHDLISTVFIFQFLISILFIILFLLSIHLFSRVSIFQNKSNILNIKYILIILIISVPFQTYSSILFAYKKINASNLISVLQNIFLYFVTFTTSTIFFQELMLNYSIIYSLSFVLFFIYTLKVNSIKIYILKTKIFIENIKLIIKPSILFWIMSLVSNVLNNAQIFFVTYFFGLKSVPDFFLIQKLFSIINTFQLAYLSPYTVRFISCASNNEWDKIKILLKNLFYKLTLPLYIFVGLALIIFHPFLIKLWTKLSIENYGASILFFIAFFLTSISNIFSVFLNSLGHFKIQIILSLIAFLLFFFFIFMTKTFLNSYSIIFSIIPSAIFTIIVMFKYTNSIIKDKLYLA